MHGLFKLCNCKNLWWLFLSNTYTIKGTFYHFYGLWIHHQYAKQCFICYVNLPVSRRFFLNWHHCRALIFSLFLDWPSCWKGADLSVIVVALTLIWRHSNVVEHWLNFGDSILIAYFCPFGGATNVPRWVFKKHIWPCYNGTILIDKWYRSLITTYFHEICYDSQSVIYAS